MTTTHTKSICSSQSGNASLKLLLSHLFLNISSGSTDEDALGKRQEPPSCSQWDPTNTNYSDVDYTVLLENKGRAVIIKYAAEIWSQT